MGFSPIPHCFQVIAWGGPGKRGRRFGLRRAIYQDDWLNMVKRYLASLVRTFLEGEFVVPQHCTDTENACGRKTHRE